MKQFCAPLLFSVLSVFGIVGCSAPKISSLNGSVVYSAPAPYKSVLLTCPTSSGEIAAVRDADGTNRFTVELFGDTLARLWTTPLLKRESSVFPLSIRERDEEIVVVSARNLGRDSVVLEAQFFSKDRGNFLRISELARLGRDKAEKRSAYHIVTSPDGNRLLFYSFKPRPQKDSGDALDIFSVLYSVSDDRLTSQSFSYQPLEPVHQKESLHLALPIAANASGAWYKSSTRDFESDVDFNPYVFVSPYQETERGVTVDNDGIFYTVGHLYDSVFQVGRFDAVSGGQQTRRVVVRWNPELDDDFSSDEVALIPVSADSLFLFMLLRDGGDPPFCYTQGMIRFSSGTDVHLSSVVILDDVFDDHYVRGGLFYQPGRALLFLRKIFKARQYHGRSNGIPQSTTTTVYEDLTISKLRSDWADYRAEIEGRRFFPVPIIFDCLPWTKQPMGRADFIVHYRDTVMIAAMNLKTDEPEIRSSFLYATRPIDSENFHIRPDSSIVAVIGSRGEARLVRILSEEPYSP